MGKTFLLSFFLIALNAQAVWPFDTYFELETRDRGICYSVGRPSNAGNNQTIFKDYYTGKEVTMRSTYITNISEVKSPPKEEYTRSLNSARFSDKWGDVELNPRFKALSKEEKINVINYWRSHHAVSSNNDPLFNILNETLATLLIMEQEGKPLFDFASRAAQEIEAHNSKWKGSGREIKLSESEKQTIAGIKFGAWRGK